MLVRRLARPMIAAIFVSGGISALRNPKQHAEVATPVPEQTARALPFNLPSDPQQLVKIDAAVKVGAGTLFAFNRFPRLAALALAGSLVPTTMAAHRFWEEHDPGAREQQQIHFFKNLGLLGGLMLAAVDTEGRPSVAWRARRGVRSVADSTRSAAGTAAHAVADVSPF
ncbi:MAG: DoxX family membrane protein [Geodermatophilaceae bacterium]|jgi:uncharacterized membrane protein YphA (DoxX/SURF4 family)|nr:DoxX family membrane protein [Geodermatophilaceae bacterium]MDQ3457672.1 DoxX family membrane protein [Actinomycetota bacterium]